MRILFVTANRIGDAVLSTGVLARLIELHPDARFTIACGPGPAPLLEAAPGVARVLTLNKSRGDSHWLRLWLASVGRWWHMVVDLRGSGLAWLLPARRRVIMRPDKAPGHRVEGLGRLMGFDPPPVPRLWLTTEHRAEAAAILGDGPPVLAIGPTANWEGKRWPAERFVELAVRLTGSAGPLPGGRIIVAGAPEERTLVAPHLAALPSERVIDLFGRDLATVAACLARAHLFVGNDSGLMHMAAALDVPTLGLFGPSREEHYAPWGPRAAVVRTPESYETLISAPGYDHRTTGTLMGSLGVDRVEEAVLALRARVERLAA